MLSIANTRHFFHVHYAFMSPVMWHANWYSAITVCMSDSNLGMAVSTLQDPGSTTFVQIFPILFTDSSGSQAQSISCIPLIHRLLHRDQRFCGHHQTSTRKEVKMSLLLPMFHQQHRCHQNKITFAHRHPRSPCLWFCCRVSGQWMHSGTKNQPLQDAVLLPFCSMIKLRWLWWNQSNLDCDPEEVPPSPILVVRMSKDLQL